MSFENTRSITMTPTAPAIAQRRFVQMAAAGAVAQAVADADALGVALEASKADEQIAIPVTLLDGSIQEVEAGAAIDVSAAIVAIAADATGRAIAATAGAPILGYALSSAAGAGEYITFVSVKAARLEV